MKTILLKILLLGCAAALLLPVMAQAAPSGSSLSPNALATLKRMSDKLAVAKAFTYNSRSILEVPARSGQLLTLFSSADVALRRPNQLRARIAGEAPPFHFYYDGKTVAAFAPVTKVYSLTKAPATIDAMLSGLEEETGIRFATAPLLFSNPYRELTRGLTSAVVVGPSTVHGIACEHLAFRAPGVNWEIWIESGANPVPRRLAVTFTDRPDYPRTLVEFSSWNFHPWLGAGDFVFHKPKGTTEIPFLSVLKSAGR